MSSRILLANAFWAMVSHVLSRGSLMLCSIFLARCLTTEGFATFTYFQVTMVMLSTYFAMGLGVTASRFFAEYGALNGDEESPPLGLLILLSTLMSVASFVVVMLLPRSLLGTDFLISKWVLALGVAVSVVGVVSGGGILGLEKYRQASIVSFFSAIVMLVFTVIASKSQQPLLAIWAVILALLAQISGQLFIVVRTIGLRALMNTCRWSRSAIYKIYTFAGPMLLVSVLNGSAVWLAGRLILLGGGEHEFSLYAICLQWFSLALFLPSMISRVLLPRLVRVQNGEFGGVVLNGVVVSIFPAFIFLFGVSLFSPFISNMYGSEYVKLRHLLPLFLIVATLNSPINSIGNAIVAKGGQMSWLIMTAVSFCSLFSFVLFVPHVTAMWVGVAQIFSAFIMLALVVFHGFRKRVF